ncbi:uncharacterized protein [Vulpes vulpes]|uniref:Uncharacterized protein n=1 Tax=Vulpes vulpes TaxID=9627 RepID=A0A3Q7TZS3_VULVU
MTRRRGALGAQTGGVATPHLSLEDLSWCSADLSCLLRDWAAVPAGRWMVDGSQGAVASGRGVVDGGVGRWQRGRALTEDLRGAAPPGRRKGQGQPRPCQPTPRPTKAPRRAPRTQPEGRQAQSPSEPENDGKKVTCPFNFFPGKASRLQKQHFNLNSDSTFIHGATLSRDFIKGFNRFYRTCHIRKGDGANAFSLPPEFQQRLRKQIYRENAEQSSLVQTRRSDLTAGEQSPDGPPALPPTPGPLPPRKPKDRPAQVSSLGRPTRRSLQAPPPHLELEGAGPQTPVRDRGRDTGRGTGSCLFSSATPGVGSQAGWPTHGLRTESWKPPLLANPGVGHGVGRAADEPFSPSTLTCWGPVASPDPTAAREAHQPCILPPTWGHWHLCGSWTPLPGTPGGTSHQVSLPPLDLATDGGHPAHALLAAVPRDSTAHLSPGGLWTPTPLASPRWARTGRHRYPTCWALSF